MANMMIIIIIKNIITILFIITVVIMNKITITILQEIYPESVSRQYSILKDIVNFRKIKKVNTEDRKSVV